MNDKEPDKLHFQSIQTASRNGHHRRDRGSVDLRLDRAAASRAIATGRNGRSGDRLGRSRRGLHKATDQVTKTFHTHPFTCSGVVLGLIVATTLFWT